jgi:hypothetical protein
MLDRSLLIGDEHDDVHPRDSLSLSRQRNRDASQSERWTSDRSPALQQLSSAQHIGLLRLVQRPKLAEPILLCRDGQRRAVGLRMIRAAGAVAEDVPVTRRRRVRPACMRA